MEKKKKTIIIAVFLLAVLVVGLTLFFALRNSTDYIDDDESEFLDFDDNLEEESSLDLDVSESEIADYTDYDYSEIDLTYDSTDAIYVDLDEVSEIYEITSAGTYIFSGELEGQIIVTSEDEESVKIVLNGVDISSSDGSPIDIEAAEETIIFLADGTTNYIIDTSEYEDPDVNEDATPAAIFSRDDLYFSGSGTLIIESENKCGIQSKDQIVITDGDIIITAGKEAIKAKDYLIIEDGNLDLTAGEDGISVTEEDEEDKGWIEINGGTIKINSENDGISAKTYLIINGGNLDITTNSASADKSAKALKSDYYIEINDGTISIDSAEDGIHSNSEIIINDGAITISAGDDGIHADELVEINDGNIEIEKSVEGIEGKNIYINNGYISIISSDDGINVADSSGSSMGGMMSALSDAALYINNGYIYINANGDGLDSNGDMYITGGTILVDGPTNSANGAIDCNGEAIIDGGYLVAVGASGMAESFNSGSEQTYVLLTFSTLSAGTEISIEDSSGNELMSFTSAKTFSSLVFSSEDLNVGETYNFYVNGESIGEFTVSESTSSGSYNNQQPSGGMTGRMR